MRNLSGTITTILGNSSRKIDYSIDIVFPDSTSFRFATLPVTKDKGVYTNDLEAVGELQHTLENPVNQVRVELQNKDRILGIHVAQYYQKWRKASAVIERLYRNASGTSEEWVEFYRGDIQQPDATDLKVVFDVMSDVHSSGLIVADKTLAEPCSAIFKDPKTCGYSGPLLTCDYLLKSAGGCDGRANSAHYLGFGHRYPPEESIPGTGGNTGTGGGVRPCPRIDQYVLARGENNQIAPKMAGFLTDKDYLWNPVKQKFSKVKSVELVKNQPIFEFISSIGAVGYSSEFHPIIQNIFDEKGKAVKSFQPNDTVLTVVEKALVDSKCLISQFTGEHFDVIKIELEEGHIYAYGDSIEKFIVCHNYKDPTDV